MNVHLDSLVEIQLEVKDTYCMGGGRKYYRVGCPRCLDLCYVGQRRHRKDVAI
jgi:hypothetical protein